MKTLSTTIFLLFLIALGFTQVSTTEIEYGYDAAGNRILRRVITVGGGGMASKKGADTEQEEPTILTDKVGSQEIQLYPNPTTEKFTVAFSNYQQNQAGQVALFDLQGKLLTQDQLVSSTVEITLFLKDMGIKFSI